MSPYGMPIDMGGDNKSNDKWMENCVNKVMKQGKSKESAIAICKATYMKAHHNEKMAEFILMEIISNSPNNN